MGILLNPFGDIRGRVGNLVYSKRNGKITVSRCPKRRAQTTSPAVAAWKEKFKFTIWVASAINRNPLLKAFWPKVGTCNKIFKENINRPDPASPNYQPIIIPGMGFPVVKHNISFIKYGIELTVSILLHKCTIDIDVEKWIAAAGIIVLRDPINKVDRELCAIEIKSSPEPIINNKPIKMEMSLCGENASIYSGYKTIKVILVLVTLTKEGAPVKHSITLNADKIN